VLLGCVREMFRLVGFGYGIVMRGEVEVRCCEKEAYSQVREK
jgi:hypothetical protein